MKTPRNFLKAELDSVHSSLKKVFRWRRKALNDRASVFLMKRGKCLKGCFQLIGVGQNSKEKFSKFTWSLLALRIARNWC